MSVEINTEKINTVETAPNIVEVPSKPVFSQVEIQPISQTHIDPIESNSFVPTIPTSPQNILSEVDIPKTSGDEIRKIIAEKRPGEQIPVL